MTVRVWAAFLALCLIWGTPYFFIKTAVHELSPVWVAWGRLVFGTVLLLPIAWHRGAFKNLSKHRGTLIAFALVELVGPFYLIALGEKWVSSSLAGILLAAVPLVVVMTSPLMGVHEKVGPRRLLGLCVGLGGVVALLGIDTLHGTQQWLGAASILAATIGYALGPLIVQRHLKDVDSLGVVAASVAIGAAVLTVPAYFSAPPVMPTMNTIASVIILGVLCTAAGLLLFVYIISHAGAARATVVTYVNPAVAVLLGVFLLGEHFGIGAAVGLLLILIGSWLATGGAKAAH